MEISDFIDGVAQKYGYDDELISALKRCVPEMIEGKTEEDVQLLMDTLERVEIFTFDEKPTREQVDAITKSKVNGRNDHIKTIDYDKGEYGKEVSPGAYTTEPIFDEDMNIVDRVGYIYLTNLYSKDSKDPSAEFYGTKINLSHLIHELGHAWASQKGEYEQDENGDYVMAVGASRYHNRVDRKTHTVEETGIDGLYVEEALNSIEEEEALYRVLNVNSYKEIPRYVPSVYQGPMTYMMRYYIENLGKSAFDGIRIQKDRTEIEKFQEVFDETAFMKDSIQGEEYYAKKGEDLTSAEGTSMSDSSKKRIKDFFEKYRELYLTPHRSLDFIEHLDRVMEQIYNFEAIKYSFDLDDDGMRQAYCQTQNAILVEGYIPINQALDIMEERKKQQEMPQVTLSGLAREALEDNIRSGEVTALEGKEKKMGEEQRETDEPNK